MVFCKFKTGPSIVATILGRGEVGCLCIRAGEPANLLVAPAPDFFFQAAPASEFFPIGSGSGFW